MIPENKNEYEITETIKGRKIGLTLEASATEHLMSVLTKLYANPALATLRELASNAWDSHISAGQKAPIEISLPTPLRPVLMVRDFGTGMSEDDIEQIYTRYGASTKRDTNEQTGMLGLGCKAPLAYCDQFTLVSIKDGQKIEASIAKNERGAGELTIAKSVPTNKPNGVTVIVPAERYNNFAELAVNLFKFWPAGSVLVNGDEPAKIDGLKLNDKFMLVDSPNNSNSNRHTIVMGGVPYPTELADVGIPPYKSLVIFVPIGSLQFTPSREGLEDTPKTRETIASLIDEYRGLILKDVKAKLKAVKSRSEGLKVVAEYSAFLKTKDIDDLRIKGNKIPNKIDNAELAPGPDPYPDPAPIRIVRPISSWQKQNTHSTPINVPAHLWPDYVWVTNFQPKKFNAAAREKLYTWAEKVGRDKQETVFLLLIEDLPARLKPWLVKDAVVDWPDVRKAARKPKGTATSTANDHYEVYDEVRECFSGEIHADDLIKSEHVFYFDAPRTSNYTTTYSDGGAHNTRAKLLTMMYDGATVVRTAKNRQGKLCRLVPQATQGIPAIAKAYDKWKSKLTDEEKKSLYYRLPYYGASGSINVLDPSKIKDPMVKEIVKEYTFIKGIKKTKKHEVRDLFKKAGHIESDIEWNGMEKLTKSYPLLSGNALDHTSADDATLYINHKYSTVKATPQKKVGANV